MGVTTKGHVPAPQTRYRVPLQGADKQLGVAKSEEELGKQLEALQARVVAAEDERKKLRRRAEAVGITAAGTAGREERLNVKRASGDHGGNLYFNSGCFGYSNRTPPKIPNDPGKVISWLRRMQLFLGREGLEHTLTSNPTCPVYVVSCKDCDFLVSIHREKLVADHQKTWGYLLEATCNTEIEKHWSLAAMFPRWAKLFRGGLCLLVMVVVQFFLSTAVIERMAVISPAGVLDSSMAVGIDISPSSLYTSNIINNIYHAIRSVVSLIGSNAFAHHYDNDITSRIFPATSSVVPIIVATLSSTVTPSTPARRAKVWAWRAVRLWADSHVVPRRIADPIQRTDGLRTQVIAMRKD